jgi:hypothetical protein
MGTLWHHLPVPVLVALNFDEVDLGGAVAFIV